MKNILKTAVLVGLLTLVLLATVSCGNILGNLFGDNEETTTPEVTTPEVTTPEVTTPEQTTPAHSHVFGTWTTTQNPTCTEKGQQERTCSCGEKETQEINALGHTEVVDPVVKATCATNGLTEGKHCSVCNEILVEQTVIPKIGHSFCEWYTVKEATETAEGEKRRDCNMCSTFETSPITELTHNHDNWAVIVLEAVAPTCTTTGLTEGKQCSGCNEILVAQEIIPALGHTEVIDEAVEATCSTSGLTDGKHCPECGEVLIAQEVVPAKGHQYENGVCTECGDNYTVDHTQYFIFTLLGDDTYEISDLKSGYPAELVIPSTYLGKAVTSIGNSAFYCSNLTSIMIPGSVTSIGVSAFYNCTALTSITIPVSVTSIGLSVFYECSNLTSIVVEEENPIYYSKDNCIIEKQTQTLVSGCINSIIPSTVTTIGEYAFSGCVGLTSITIPNSITSIGNCAFNCSDLTSIIIPDSVASIGDYAFNNCRNLTSITILNSITSIGDEAFAFCENLKSVTLGSAVTGINDVTFYSCDNLATVFYCGTPNDWKFFEFNNRSSLLSTAHRYYYSESHPCSTAYEYWHYVDSVSTPWVPRAHTETISEAVVATCTTVGLTEGKHCSECGEVLVAQEIIPMLDHIVVVDKAIAATCTTAGLTEGTHCSECKEVLIAQEVVPVNEHQYEKYTCIECGDGNPQYFRFSIMSDGTYEISHLKWLNGNEVVIPSAYLGKPVTSIGSEAFYGYTDLTSITIPNSITKIGIYAFFDCSGLVNVYITDLEAWLNITFGDNSGAYVFANPCSYGGNLYLNGTLLTSVTIPDSITNLGNYVFDGCTSISSITIPDSVISIGKRAFFGCTGLTSIIIPDGVTSIGDMAFCHCSNLTSVTIPDSVISIGNGAFSTDSDLNYNTYDNAYYLGNANNPYVLLVDVVSTSISSCLIHEDTKIIHSSAFCNCSNLTSIKIPNSVTEIGGDAFWLCASLTSINIPAGVSYIAYGTFADCVNLTSVNIPDNVTVIDSGAFRNCTSLTSVNIPDNVTVIGSDAFRNCTSLTSVTIGNNVTIILSDAFRGCSSLTSIAFDGTIQQWNDIVLFNRWNVDVPATEVVCSDGVVKLN